MVADDNHVRSRLQSMLDRWRSSVLIAVVAVLFAFVGGALIRLNPGYTSLIVGVVVIVALVMLSWIGRRRVGLLEVLPFWLLAGVITFAVIQLVPYGRDHPNPPTTGEPAWSSPRTRELMFNACGGCHSNEVEWPWYSNIAPMSWAITDHVDEGREAANYSELATNSEGSEETIEVILEGSMPPGYYTRFGLHPEANLSDAERAELIVGLRATPGFAEGETEGGGESGEGVEDHDDDSGNDSDDD